MSSFEYFTTLLSIILGFALAGVIRAIGRIISSSNLRNENWLAAVWNATLLIQITVYWIVLWRLFSNSEEIKFWVLIVYTLGTVVLYLASFVLESRGQESSPAVDEDQGPGKVFFFCLTAHMIFVMGHITTVQAGVTVDVDAGGVLGWIAAGLCLIGATLKRRSHHLVLVTLYMTNMLGIGLINTVAFAN